MTFGAVSLILNQCVDPEFAEVGPFELLGRRIFQRGTGEIGRGVGPVLDVVFNIVQAVKQLRAEVLALLLAAVGEWAEMVGVDAIDLLAHRTHREYGLGARDARVGFSHILTFNAEDLTRWRRRRL